MKENTSSLSEKKEIKFVPTFYGTHYIKITSHRSGNIMVIINFGIK